MNFKISGSKVKSRQVKVFSWSNLPSVKNKFEICLSNYTLTTCHKIPEPYTLVKSNFRLIRTSISFSRTDHGIYEAINSQKLEMRF